MIDTATSDSKCPVCQETEIDILLEIPQVPIHCNVQWPTFDEAIRAPRGDIRLGFCQACGHIFNLDFNPTLMAYTQTYENSLHFSPRFQSYAEGLASRLIKKYYLRNKDIIEIGCGQGDFLKILCELGQNRGVGFDRSYVPEPDNKEETKRVTFIQDFYSERYAHYQTDCICCRHVLEHIQNPIEFMTTIRQAIGDRSNTVVFFEVPNALFTLRDLAIWDIIYEHCSYFSSHSLAYLFSRCGYSINDISETFEGQFLGIEALPGESAGKLAKDNLAEVTSLIGAFADKYQTTTKQWHDQLHQMEQTGKRVVIWGTGSKGVTFLNALGIQAQIRYAVDINPRKEGMYVPGTGQQIVPPEFLRDYHPDNIIVMNPIYKDEISQIIQQLGLTAELILAMA